jgi:hypothetical protein
MRNFYSSLPWPISIIKPTAVHGSKAALLFTLQGRFIFIVNSHL